MKNLFNSDDDSKCPVCAAVDFEVLGVKGFAGRQLATMLFGFPASFAFSKAEEKNTKTKAIIHKCNKCGNKWTPVPATTDEKNTAETPCAIHFTRENSLINRVLFQFVYLNGKKIGAVKNGERITFATERKHNVIFVTDHSGRALDTRRFDVFAGERIEFKFRQKFL
jgi:hypothetical protein